MASELSPDLKSPVSLEREEGKTSNSRTGPGQEGEVRESAVGSGVKMQGVTHEGQERPGESNGAGGGSEREGLDPTQLFWKPPSESLFLPHFMEKEGIILHAGKDAGDEGACLGPPCQ